MLLKGTPAMTTQAPTQIADVAQGLAQCCREGRFEDAVKQYYSPEIVTIEMCGMPGMDKEMQGLEAVAQKGQWWNDNHEVHSLDVSEPMITPGHFAVTMAWDVTHRASGQRMLMTELAVYEVQDGKIVREQFFYPMAKECGNTGCC